MSRKSGKQSLGLTALAAAVAAASGAASAATFTVENLNATGEGSLADAIELANESGGSDTIRFAVAGTLDLGYYTLPNICGGLTITGPGRGSLRIVADQSEGDVFDVDLYCEGNVSISGLTISGARSDAIDAYGPNASLLLRDVALRDSGSADDPTTSSLLNVRDGANVTLVSSRIENNHLQYGGAIYVDEAGLVVYDTVITGNEAAYGAAAAVVNEGYLGLENSLVSGNTNTEDGSGGVGVKYGAELFAENTRFLNNASENGRGGAMAVKYAESFVYESTFTGNSAADDGGAVYARGSDVYLEHSTLSGNTVTGEEGRGGAVFATNDSYIGMYSSVVRSNRADFGGGLAANNESELDFEYSQVISNRANLSGGGLYADEGAQIDLDESVISGNIASGPAADGYGKGGGIAAPYLDYIALDNSVVRNNSATGTGGGIYVSYANSSRFKYSSITGNTAKEGGGLVIDTGGGWFKYSTLSGNSATGAYGGLDLLITDEDSFDVKYSTLANNRSGDGAALRFRVDGYSGLDIDLTTISGNVGTGAPAVEVRGLYNYSDLDVITSTFSGNRANGYPAALQFANLESTDVFHSTFVDNNAGTNLAQLHLAGGGDTYYSPEVEIYNSVFTSLEGDEIVVGGSDLTAVDSGTDFNLDVTFRGTNIMEKGWSYAEGTGEASVTVLGSVDEVDPMVLPLANNGGFTLTHALKADSPAIDTGEGDTREGPDQRGVDTQNGNSDLGAVEFTDNRAPRLVAGLSGRIGGVVGREVGPFFITDAFVDPDGDGLIPVVVSGLPAGLNYDEGTGEIEGTLESTGEYRVTVVVRDDADPSLTTVEEFTVRVLATAPVADDDDDDDFLGGTSSAFFGLMAAMGWLRRRKRS